MVLVSSFPLLRLPRNATTVTLRIMNYLQLFEISLVSKKTRGLVQSLKISAAQFTVYINIEFSVSLWFPGKSFCYIHYLSNHMYFLAYEKTTERWFLNEMDGRTLINHMKLIFNCSKIKVEFGTYSEQFNFELLLKERQEIESIKLMTNNQEENERVLNIIKPLMVTIDNLPPTKDIAIQNFDYIFLYETMVISLEYLLILNVRNFEVDCQMITSKLLNRFLKLWMRGSNLQLESLKLSFPINNDFSEEKIFYQLKTASNKTVRDFKSASGTYEITDGTNIIRFNGTRATIRVDNRSTDCDFEMYVWHDHCIAQDTTKP